MAGGRVMNIFARLFRRGNLEKQPFIHLSDTPPAPIINPAWQPAVSQPMPRDIQAQMYRAAAEAWRNWKPEALAKTAPLAKPEQREAVVDDTLLLRRARPVHFDPLPLMGNPFGADTAWRERAILGIRTLRGYLDAEQRCTLDLAERHPEWLHIDIQIHALAVPTWQLPNVRFQVGPVLFDVLRCTLNLDATVCDISPVIHVRDGREIGWSALLWVDDRQDDGMERVA